MWCSQAVWAASLAVAVGGSPGGPDRSSDLGGPQPFVAPRTGAGLRELKPHDQKAVRRAVDLARGKLASPGCAEVYEDFALPAGGTPRGELDRRGMEPEEFLETLVFTDGSREPSCRAGRALMATKPGWGVISVCPGFAEFQIGHPGRSASFIIHESLHALGLGENPPTSGEITNRVEWRCWKTGRRVSASSGASPGWRSARARPR
jgi:hypothetical protein